jgi:hypothetical protein
MPICRPRQTNALSLCCPHQRNGWPAALALAALFALAVAPAAGAGDAWVLWEKTDTFFADAPPLFGRWKIAEAFESKSNCDSHLTRKTVTYGPALQEGRDELGQFRYKRLPDGRLYVERGRLSWWSSNLCLPAGIVPNAE